MFLPFFYLYLIYQIKMCALLFYTDIKWSENTMCIIKKLRVRRKWQRLVFDRSLLFLRKFKCLELIIQFMHLYPYQKIPTYHRPCHIILESPAEQFEVGRCLFTIVKWPLMETSIHFYISAGSFKI